MNKELRQIIREEVYKVMMEMGEEDPMKLSQQMIDNDEEMLKSLEAELKWKENDARVSGLPKDEKDARVAAAKVAKDKVEKKKQELELSKQAQVNAVKYAQMQTQMQSQQDGQSQIEPQI